MLFFGKYLKKEGFDRYQESNVMLYCINLMLTIIALPSFMSLTRIHLRLIHFYLYSDFIDDHFCKSALQNEESIDYNNQFVPKRWNFF